VSGVRRQVLALPTVALFGRRKEVEIAAEVGCWVQGARCNVLQAEASIATDALQKW